MNKKIVAGIIALLVVVIAAIAHFIHIVWGAAVTP